MCNDYELGSDGLEIATDKDVLVEEKWEIDLDCSPLHRYFNSIKNFTLKWILFLHTVALIFKLLWGTTGNTV